MTLLFLSLTLTLLRFFFLSFFLFSLFQDKTTKNGGGSIYWYSPSVVAKIAEASNVAAGSAGIGGGHVARPRSSRKTCIFVPAGGGGGGGGGAAAAAAVKGWPPVGLAVHERRVPRFGRDAHPLRGAERAALREAAPNMGRSHQHHC